MNAKLARTPAEHLAAFLASIRPDWDTAGIVQALGNARPLGTAAEIAHAAIRAAGEPTNRTPAVIALAGPHWKPPEPRERTETPMPDRIQRCPRCGRILTRGHDHTDADCQPQDPNRHQQGAAAARAAIQTYQPPAHLQPQARHDTVEAHVVTPQPEPEPGEEEPNDEEVEPPF